MTTTLDPIRPGGPFDHRRAPLLEATKRFLAADITPFCTPGHKRGHAIDAEYAEVFGAAFLNADIPMGGGLDTTHFNHGLLVQAELLGADAWGAERTYYLINGSSTGNHAFMLGTLRPGDKVIIARDIHKSLMVALIVAGVQPIYLAPELHPELAVGLGITPAAVEAALEEHPDAKLVALVSPSYCGVPSDLVGIAAVAHARGVPVYVDEAWGPHFHFHPRLPMSAMASGVDGSVGSTHKILGAVTQTAVLNLQGSLIDTKRIGTAVGMVQSTSPSAPLFVSIDASRRQMMLEGRERLEGAIALAEDARRRLQAIPGIKVLDAAQLGLANYDLTKLMIDVNELGLTGFETEDLMRNRFGLQPEMSDLVSVMCIVTIGDSQASIDKLVGAFEVIGRERKGAAARSAAQRSSGVVIAPGQQAMIPRDAFFAPARAVPLAEAVGAVSAELVIPYPPGIPVLAPGDVISAEKAEYLREGVAQGMYLSGPEDHELRTIRIVDR